MIEQHLPCINYLLNTLPTLLKQLLHKAALLSTQSSLHNQHRLSVRTSCITSLN